MKVSWFRTARAAVGIAAVGIVAVAASVAAGGVAAAQSTPDAATVTVTGDSADPVTGGVSRSFSVGGGNWINMLPSPDFSGFGVHVSSAAGEEWTLAFAAPTGKTLRPGTYRAVEFNSAGTRAGMAVFEDDYRCETVTGTFTVLAASFRNGYVERFDATFEQHCEGRRAAARGEIHIANLPLPAMAATTSSGTFDQAGAAHPAGAVTCSAPMRVSVLGTVTQKGVTGDFTVEVDCTPDRAATWTATVPGTFARGKARVDLDAYAYLIEKDTTIDDHSPATVRLTRG